MPADTTTDHRRATAERNVEAILDAAEALLARGAAASTSAVAAQAGVSRVTVYAHFATREALLEAVVERVVRRATAAIAAARIETGTPLEALERLVAAAWGELERNRVVAQAASEQLSPRALVPAVLNAPDLTLTAAVSRAAAGRDLGEALGSDTLGVPVHDRVAEALDGIDVLIDYTSATAVKAHTLAAIDAGVAVVVGSSGLTAADFEGIDAA